MRKVFTAVVVAGVISCIAGGPATAALPLTKTQPYQAVCEAQGGIFQLAIDFRSLYCDKEGGLLTAFTETQLALQRTLCLQVYDALFFGVQGMLPNSTGTFCSIG